MNNELSTMKYKLSGDILNIKTQEDKIYGLQITGTINRNAKQTKYGNYMLVVSLNDSSVKKLQHLYSDLKVIYQKENIPQNLLKPLYIVNDVGTPTMFQYLSEEQVKKGELNCVNGLNAIKLNVYIRPYMANKYKFKFTIHSLSYEPTQESHLDVDFM